MAKRFKLSSKKKKWAKQTKPSVTMRGTALNFPAGVESRYQRDVRKILEDVMKRTEKELTKLFESPQAQAFFAEDAAAAAHRDISLTPSRHMFAADAGIATRASKVLDDLFGKLDAMAKKRAKATSKKMVDDVDQSSKTAIAGSLKELSGGLTIAPASIGDEITERLRAAINVNVDLITSISDAYLSKVADAVNRSIMLGNGLADLIPFFEKQRGITKRHAKFVALDQTRKAYNSLNLARMEEAGLSEFEWLHSMGGKVPRKFHIDRFPAGLNGGIYSIADPPVIDEKTGEKGYPAQLPSCRCRMVPVLVLEKGKLA